MLPAAVLFDLDGLLVDSEPIWYDVEYAAVERLGGQWSREHQAACVGGTIDQTCAYILRLTGSTTSAVELQVELLSAMTDRFHAGVPLHDGAVELIAEIAVAGIPMALVSSSYRVMVDAALLHFPPGTFAVTVSGDEVQHGKPDPEPYAIACARLSVAPRHCVVLEDAPMGVVSAEAAGCSVIAIPEHGRIEERPGRQVVQSLREVTLHGMCELVAANPG